MQWDEKSPDVCTINESMLYVNMSPVPSQINDGKIDSEQDLTNVTTHSVHVYPPEYAFNKARGEHSSE